MKKSIKTVANKVHRNAPPPMQLANSCKTIDMALDCAVPTTLLARLQQSLTYSQERSLKVMAAINLVKVKPEVEEYFKVLCEAGAY